MDHLMVNAAAAAHNWPHFPCEHISIESTCTLHLCRWTCMQTPGESSFFALRSFPSHSALQIALSALGAFHRETAACAAGEWKEDLLRLALPAIQMKLQSRPFAAPFQDLGHLNQRIVRRPRYVYRRRSERNLTLSIVVAGRTCSLARLLCVSRSLTCIYSLGRFLVLSKESEC
jgi:hypothetical protein